MYLVNVLISYNAIGETSNLSKGGTIIRRGSPLAPRRHHGCSCFFLRTLQVGRGNSLSTTFRVCDRYLSVCPRKTTALFRVSHFRVFLGRPRGKRRTLGGTISTSPGDF